MRIFCLAILLVFGVISCSKDGTPLNYKSESISVSVGGFHSCSLQINGSIKCWGANNYGQLGNGNTADSATPVTVSGISNGASAVSSGAQHTCAIFSDGVVKCWGYNNFGQLGNGGTTDSTIPVTVSGISSGAIAISSGAHHTCALLTNGAVKCWGNNTFGQLGNSGTTDSPVPVSVTNITITSGATNIAAGSTHTCALLSGNVHCWGRGNTGALGNGGTVDSVVPVAVSGIIGGTTAITSGNGHTCAKVNGAIRCWGANSSGELGDMNTTDLLLPVTLSGTISAATVISPGGFHTCAIVSGAINCWGSNNYGQLGNGETSNSLSPVVVYGITAGASAISSGTYHNCAIVSGRVRCWGYNNFGQLGTISVPYSSIPIEIEI